VFVADAFDPVAAEPVQVKSRTLQGLGRADLYLWKRLLEVFARADSAGRTGRRDIAAQPRLLAFDLVEDLFNRRTGHS